MKKSIPVFLFIAAFLFSAFAVNFPLYPQGTNITIIHFNDSHSNISGSGPKTDVGDYMNGGFDRAATVIKSARISDSNVLVFDAGDFSTGSFYFNRYFGVPELTLMKRLNFDAITIGNHEFDLGPAVLYNTFLSSFLPGSIPVLSANLNMSGFPALNSYISPYTVKDVSGVKVGIFGLTINDPSSNPSPVIISDSIMQIAQSTVTALQTAGCNIIICLSHLGYGYDYQLAMNIPGIHIILGGHDHAYFTQPVPVPNPAGFNTLVCRAGAYYQFAGKLSIFYNAGTVSMKSYELITLDSGIPRDDTIKAAIDSLKQGITERYGDVLNGTVCFALNDITPSYNSLSANRDTPLGNFITDAHRKRTGTRIALTAIGLMSQPLYRGPVKGEDLLRTTPYGFDTSNGLNQRLMTFNITGSELIRGLELVLYAAGYDAGYMPQSSGLKFYFDSKQALGFKIIQSSVKVNDTLINMSGTYSVTANQGLYKALTLLGLNITDVQTTEINEYTSLNEYARSLRKISYTSQGRIKDVSVTRTGDPVTAVTDFKLYQNYPNPFNPSTKIKFSLSKNSFVNLTVYDVNGRQIAVLENESKPAGEYSLTYNAAVQSSGIYFYKLTIDGKKSETKSMILLK
ncbi:MAG: 5'-nucleotidase C-terminal domain-containing protein [Bacteroidetes bacterium]|nr:5'-nucleotidase C-terminal domain-containing protein [Bacteroidota bacterium]